MIEIFFFLINMMASANFFLRVSAGQLVLLLIAYLELDPGLPRSSGLVSWEPNSWGFQ